VFIGSNDIFLYPGSLKAAMDFKKENDVVIWHLHAFNFFLINKNTMDKVGWFDENFYPAYKEDQDFSYRCKLAQAQRVSGIPNSRADHFGSATIRSNPVLAAQSKQNRAWRVSYYKAKWGGDAGKEVFRNPFNNTECDHRWWPNPDEKMRLCK
jgi:GT2 family glycosyltransferase